MRRSLLLLAACDDTLFGVLPEGATDTGDPVVLSPDYAADVEPIWLDHCAGCHTDGGASGDLALDAGEAALVSVAASQVPSLALVEPGDPERSYLWQKVTGADGIEGRPMPFGAPLSAGHLGTVEAWITSTRSP